jgi:hypothetical protein
MLFHKNKTRIINPGTLIEGLCKSGIEFILVGALASVIQGAPVMTMDVDIVHRRTEENIKKLLKFLKSVRAYYRRPDDKMIEPKKEDLQAGGHVLLSTQHGALDILAVIEKGRGYEDLIPDAVAIQFRGYKIQVLSLAAIIELKKDSADPKDISRMPIFKETLRQDRERKG